MKGNEKQRFRDLTGIRFGKLTAQYPTDKRKDGSVIWHCRCDCGNELDVSARYLVRGYTKHCGCSRAPRENPSYRDLSGMRLGQLLVLRRTDQRSNGSIVWECRCDCGNTAYISENNLVHGHQKSCGCAKKIAQENIHSRLHFVNHTCVEFLKRLIVKSN